MDITIQSDALDKTAAVVNSASDRTPVADFELLVVGNRISVTLRFCDDDGATPAFVTDGTVIVDIGLGYPSVDGSTDYASTASLAVSGSTRAGTLDLNTAELLSAVYNGVIGCGNNQRLAQAPFVFEVRTTTAAGLVQTLALQRAYVSFRVAPLVLDSNPNPGYLAVLYDPSTGLLVRPTAIPVLSGGVPSGGSTAYVLTKLSATSYDYAWQAAGAASLPPQTGNAGKFLTTDGTNASWAAISGTGSVTTVSVVTANGFAGTVANASSTPAITLKTSITGLLKGNGTAISAAVAGTDYQAALTIGNLTEATSSVLTISGGTGAIIGSGLTIQVKAASGSQSGYLSSTDWTTFNSKQAAGNYITALTGDVTASGPGSAAATLANTAVSASSYGSSTSIPSFTVDSKGRLTAAAGNVVIAPAGTLTGTTLAATVVTSSLTAVGTITTGTWQGTAIAAGFVATLNQNTTGSAASLSITGQTGLLTVVGLASTNRVKTVRDAADTILELGGSYTPTGTWTNAVMVTPNLGTPSTLVVTNASGTASININGTVGATTPAAGTFTSATSAYFQAINNASAPGFIVAASGLYNAQADGTFPTVQQDAWGTGFFPVWISRAARGTATTPTAIQSGDVLGRFQWRGHNGTAYTAMVANIAVTAAENFAVGATGSTMIFQVTATGSTTNVSAATLTSTGFNSTVIGATTPAAATVTTLTTTGAIELGAASDTTLARVSAGAVSIEGVPISTASNALTLTNKTLTAPTLGGTMQMLEQASLHLDAALSADGTYCGITEAGTAGSALAFGDLVYLQASDSRWELTDADADATAGPLKLGMCVLAAAADGDPTVILLIGKIRADANFPTLTIGAPVYVSTTTGDVQVAQPSGTDDVIRIVGYGNTADELYFNPASVWTTHT